MLKRESKKQKIPLIYILSNGRSGSTVLDLSLGSFDHIWTLGEAHLIELELQADGICGSGEKINASAFWQPLLPTLQFKDELTSIGFFRKTAPGTPSHVGKVLRWKLLWQLYLNQKKSADLVRSYGRLNANYFYAVKKHAEDRGFSGDISWLVDASKDPYRLMWLQQSNLFNIKVIHLVKHPCAFVFSNSLKYKEDKIPYRIGRMTARWIIENQIMRKICTKFFEKNNVFLLQYERLASDFAETLEAVGQQFDINLSGFKPEYLHGYTNYAISGNKSRWEKRPLFLDDGWKKELPTSYKKAIQFATAPYLKVYGYA